MTTISEISAPDETMRQHLEAALLEHIRRCRITLSALGDECMLLRILANEEPGTSRYEHALLAADLVDEALYSAEVREGLGDDIRYVVGHVIRNGVKFFDSPAKLLKSI